MFDLEKLKSVRGILSAARVTRRKGLSTLEMQVAAAPAILKRCLARQPFTTSQVWADTPELQATQRTSNALGTALGAGINGRDGLDLVTDHRGFRPVFENAAVAIGLLEEAGSFPQVIDALGLSEPEIRERIAKLECAKEESKSIRDTIFKPLNTD